MSENNKVSSEQGTLNFHKKHFGNSLRKATLCFLIKGRKILLAEKRRGFAVGKLNGVGGKLNENESVEEALARETKEEIGVDIVSHQKVAELDFYFADNQDFNQKVLVYISDSWKGTPSESEEMAPSWYSIENIPYEKMWSDDIYWLPLVIEGKMIRASFLFDKSEKVLEKELIEVDSL
jgi:8-oxo-dGTP pyrophosphatase MutT (NUDIX family)